MAIEPTCNHLIQHLDEGIVKAIHIEEAHGFPVMPDMCPSERFGDFLKCPNAARKGHKGIRVTHHFSFARMHIRRDDRLCHPIMRDASRVEVFGCHTGHRAAIC